MLDTTTTGLKGIKITNSNKYTYSLGDADYSNCKVQALMHTEWGQ